MSNLKLAVLASGRGSNLQAILDAIDKQHINAEVVAVLSDKEKALALQRAQERNIPGFWVNPGEFASKKDFESRLLEIIREKDADYIILAGFMRVLSSFFVRQAGIRILNIHPSLLPSFPGLHAQKQAVEYGVRYSGCTVHFVDEGVDSGPIILQAVVPVHPGDTEDTLAERILKEEHRLYPEAIKLLSQGRIKCSGRKVSIIGEGE